MKIMEEDHFSGEWQSTYSYRDGAEASEHMVILQQNGTEIAGESRPQADGSRVMLRLEYDTENHVLTGTWRERTSPAGRYGGAEFHGALQFIVLSSEKLEGAWVGFNSDRTRVNGGEWALERK